VRPPVSDKLGIVFAMALLGSGCRGHSAADAVPTAKTDVPVAHPESSTAIAEPKVAASAAPLESRPQLRSEGDFVALTVEGFGDAVVSVPNGATTPRPVVVAVHGNYNRPDTLCEAWRPVFGERVFILCPRGVERHDSPSLDDQRYTYDDFESLAHEIDVGLRALRARFGAFVDEGPMIYAGFSLGANMGVFVAGHQPDRFPRVILVEGGGNRWVPDVLTAFSKGGGKRVLFVCAQPDCAGEAPFTISRLEAAGVKAEAVIGNPIGHHYDGAVAETTRGALPWLLEDDTRFK
jgi:hypothetical protein